MDLLLQGRLDKNDSWGTISTREYISQDSFVSAYIELQSAKIQWTRNCVDMAGWGFRIISRATLDKEMNN